MGRIRIFIVLVIAWIVFLFSLEQININDTEPFDLNDGVYVGAIIICMVYLFSPGLAQRGFAVSSTFTAGILVYLAITAYFEYSATGSLMVYRLMSEAAILLWTWLLMRRVNHTVYDFDESVQRFVLNVDNSRLHPLAEGANRINDELYRARRFERPLALIYSELPIEIEQEDGFFKNYGRWRVDEDFKLRYMQVEMARHVIAISYKSDILVEYGDGVVVCLPECSQAEAENFARQLIKHVKSSLEIEPLIGIANYPKDGLVFDDLANSAEANALLQGNLLSAGGDNDPELIARRRKTTKNLPSFQA
jgi:hypothetical protein